MGEASRSPGYVDWQVLYCIVTGLELTKDRLGGQVALGLARASQRLGRTMTSRKVHYHHDQSRADCQQGMESVS